MSRTTETFQSSIQELSKMLEVPSGLIVPHLSEIYVRNYEKDKSFTIKDQKRTASIY